MTKYAEVINLDGRVTVDDETARLVKTRTITLEPGYQTLGEAHRQPFVGSDALSNQYILNGISYFDISLSETEKLVAVRCLNQHSNVIVLGGYISARTYRLYLWGNWDNPNTYAEDYVVDIYGEVEQQDIVNYGMQVFNASGKKIFDSNYYYMDIDGTYQDDYHPRNDNVVPMLYEWDRQRMFGYYEMQNHSVAIGSTYKFVSHASEYYSLAIVVYGIVFNNDRIYLEMRGSVLSDLIDGNIHAPWGFGTISSGIILDSTNVS